MVIIIFFNNNNGQTTIRPDKLEFEIVPLPPLVGGGDGAVVEDAFSYSKFTSSSSSATFLFGPNYDTHVPNRNVVSIVGVEEGAGMTGGSNRPGVRWARR